MVVKTITPQEFVEGTYFEDKRFYFSYSSLNKLLYCPEMFYKEYILGEKDLKDETYFTEGKLIHCLLLEPKNFEKQYIVMTGKMPSDNTKTVVERVYAHHFELRENGTQKGNVLSDYQDAVIDVLRDINKHQTLKTDEQRFAKIYTADANIYWDFLDKANGKTVVDAEMYEKCKSIVEKVRSIKEISDLLKLNADGEWWGTEDVYNEHPLEMKLTKFSFGLKGIVDNFVVDPVNKNIRINDFKTSSKTLADFPETVKFYKYNLQAAIYNLLVSNFYSDLIKQGYKVEFRFIVIDKHQQVYPFKVSEETMKQWTKDLLAVLAVADYHYTKKDYSLPYDFIKGNIVL